MRPEKMIAETHKWFKTGLGCIAGKREFAKKRYMFQVVSNSLGSVVRYLSEPFAPLNNSNSKEILNGGAFNFYIIYK